MHIRILGCGPSFGIPSIREGFDCCDESIKENVRLRSSVLVQIGDVNILIDTTPDIRLQMIRAGFPKVDAVLWTHDHYDHMIGADELKGYLTYTHKTLPVYATAHDMARVEQLVPYLLPQKSPEYYLERHIITPFVPFSVKGIEIMPLLQNHGTGHSIGYRIGDFAYSTDVNDMEPQSFAALKGIKLWILGVGTKDVNNPVHCSLSKALTWIEEISPQRTIFTHMGGKMDYKQLSLLLPTSVRPAYDGMELDI